MSDDKQSMAGVVLKNPLCQAIRNNLDTNSCLTFAFFETRKKKSPDCRNLLTDRCYNGRSELKETSSCWHEKDVEQPAGDYKDLKRKWLQRKPEKVQTTQRFLLTEVRMFLTDQTFRRLSRKFKAGTSAVQHQQTFP